MKHITSTGFTFNAYEIEYEIELSEYHASLLRRPTRLPHLLHDFFGPDFRSVDLKIAENGSWALYIVISARIDLHENREEIGSIIAASLVIAEGKGL